MDKYLAADMKAMGITTKKQKKLFAVVYGCAQYFFEDAFNAAGDLYDANREKGDVKFGTAVGNYCPDVVNAYEVLTPHESTPPPTAPPAYPDMDDTPMVGDQDPDQAPMF